MEKFLGDDLVADDESPNAKLLFGLLKKMEISSYSTAFSGVGSPGTAYAQLRATTSAFLGGTSIHAPEHVHAIDPFTSICFKYSSVTYFAYLLFC